MTRSSAPATQLKVFLSYSLADSDLLGPLTADIAQLGHSVWRDVNIVGGREWWAEICRQIRESDVFLLAVSPTSIRSRYCAAELAYASALGKILLQVMVVKTRYELVPAELRRIEWLDYREHTPESAIALSMTFADQVARGAARRSETTAQHVPEPDPPLGDLVALGDRINVDDLPYSAQADIVRELTDHVDGAEDVLGDLIRLMRGRPYVSAQAAQQLDALAERVSDRSAGGAAGRNLVRGLVTHVSAGRLTPIIGSGLTDPLVGSRRALAQEFATTFEFPLPSHLRNDLPQVAQFVRTTTDEETLRTTLRNHLTKQLRTIVGADTGDNASLDDLFGLAWEERTSKAPEAHRVLADVACPIYITAHPAQVLERALVSVGRTPVSDLCKWRRDVDEWPSSPFDASAVERYVPSAQQPLVYHVFGRFDCPESLVLTEDDYFDFLIRITEERDLIPPVVRRALTDSALLMLGFRLDDWDSRTLWRVLMHQEGSARRDRYKHVAVQVDLAGSAVSADDARAYLNDYFKQGSGPLGIFWGSVEEFVALLHQFRQPT